MQEQFHRLLLSAEKISKALYLRANEGETVQIISTGRPEKRSPPGKSVAALNRFYRIGNAVRQRGDLRFVLAFHHHADQRLGAGFT